MKKIIAPFIALLLAFSLCACINTNEPATQTTTAAAQTTDAAGELTNENIKEQMALIMPEAEKITAYLRLGLINVGEYDYDKAITDSENGCKYTPVIDENLNTIAKVKAMCEELFTKSYCDANLYGVFEGPYELYKEFDGVLCLNVDAGGGGRDTYVTETAQIISSSGGTVLVSMESRDSYDGKYLAYVTLKAVDGTYKIDSITTTEV